MSNTNGFGNVAVGSSSLQSNTEGWGNISIGNAALIANTTGSNNVAIGYYSGHSNVTGSGNIMLGYNSGQYETGSNSFYLNNVDQTNTAGDKAYSLLYGTFAGSVGTTTGNTLKVNGALTAATSLTTPEILGSGSYLSIGAPATSHSLSATNDLYVAGKLEIDGAHI